jgi:hypothetical protein
VPRIKPPKGDVVGRIHDHCEDVPLAHPHYGLKTIAPLREDFRLQHLRRKVLRVGAEVLHQPLEIRRGSPWRKRSAAPVVQHGSGEDRAVAGVNRSTIKLSLAQTLLALCGRGNGSEEAVLRPVLRARRAST